MGTNLEVQGDERRTDRNNEEMNGSQMVLESLSEEGVEIIFGYPAEPSCRRMTRFTKKGFVTF